MANAPTGHKFEHCCGFPFIETAEGTSDDAPTGALSVTIYPNTWGNDPEEVDWRSGGNYDSLDCINIICSRCGSAARMFTGAFAQREHTLGDHSFYERPRNLVSDLLKVKQ